MSDEEGRERFQKVEEPFLPTLGELGVWSWISTFAAWKVVEEEGATRSANYVSSGAAMCGLARPESDGTRIYLWW